MNLKTAHRAIEVIASRRLPEEVIVSFARKVLGGATVADARREALREQGTEVCEGCEARLPADTMEYDVEGVPLCSACMQGLRSEPHITSDLLSGSDK